LTRRRLPDRIPPRRTSLDPVAAPLHRASLIGGIRPAGTVVRIDALSAQPAYSALPLAMLT